MNYNNKQSDSDESDFDRHSYGSRKDMPEDFQKRNKITEDLMVQCGAAFLKDNAAKAGKPLSEDSATLMRTLFSQLRSEQSAGLQPSSFMLARARMNKQMNKNKKEEGSNETN